MSPFISLHHNPLKCVQLKRLCCLFSYQSVLTLIRARSEDSGNYTINAQTGDLTSSHSFYLQVKGETYFFTCRLSLIFVCLRSFACVGFCLCLLAVCFSWWISTSSIITLLRTFVYVFLGVNWRIYFEHCVVACKQDFHAQGIVQNEFEVKLERLRCQNVPVLIITIIFKTMIVNIYIFGNIVNYFLPKELQWFYFYFIDFRKCSSMFF